MNIGASLKIIRQHFELTQAELSNRSGLSQTAVSQFESGAKQPSKSSIEAICSALKIPESVVYLLAFQDSDVPRGRKDLYNKLYPKIRELALEILGDKHGQLLK